MRAQFTAAVDRCLVDLLRRRARRNSMVLRLLPDAWLGPLLRPSATRLRGKLVVAILALSILAAGAILWLALQH